MGLQKEPKIGVVLFQLGGPDSLEAVEPFLYNLFCDPDIIDFPFAKIARQPLAKLISISRAKKVRDHYAHIGGKSPIVEWTKRQAAALEEELRTHQDARVAIAMRYWHPFTDEAIEKLRREECNELVLLPLYPQYSHTTTRSSYNEWQRRFKPTMFPGANIHAIQSYHDHPAYIDCMVEKVNETLARFPGEARPHLVFSAHGVPVSVIQAGDPYQRHVEETTRLVLERGKWELPFTVCYQSKVGSSRWLEPSIHTVTHQMAEKKERHVLVIPIAFVSDHIETLHEIDVEVREEMLALGVEQFEMMPGLNTSPKFIQTLVELVLARVTKPALAAQAR
ncbi:MAG: ferrochelatase [Acidobacteria bacterium RIFCSPLOWO2_12_FULL_54_10]|nr:MAG: ferrochelatase [Acidobacteria bacterium RIFCSPLOWO2_12_FULL_54_10]